MTLVEMLEKNAKTKAENTAIIFHGNKLSYAELNEVVNKLAHALLEVGVKRGDRVGLMLPRIPELVEGFLATVKIGGVVVPMNFELSVKKAQSMLNNTKPKCIITHASLLEYLCKYIPDKSPIEVIVVGDRCGKYLSWCEVLSNKQTDNPGLDIRVNDIAYLNYTSGSTGDSKGAVTTHANVYWNTIAAVDAFRLTPDDIHLCMFAPFAHPHEIFARPLYLGGTMVLVDKIYPKSLAEAISAHKVTCMMGLAPMYENLLEVLEHKTYDLSALRVPESGGMYTRSELISRFRRKLGVPIFPVWGSTETTGIALANRPGEYMPPGSVGKPCNSYEVKIVDETGQELSPGEIGEMIFKGPAVVKSYYEAEAGEEISFKHSWYYSGDLGKKDAMDNFYFVERKSGMMKVAGLKVYPLEIELMLMSHAKIKEAVVIAVKNRLRGEIPKAIVGAKAGVKLSEKEVQRFCKERLAHYKLPRIVEVRESLPKIGSGKINKKALQMEHV